MRRWTQSEVDSHGSHIRRSNRDSLPPHYRHLPTPYHHLTTINVTSHTSTVAVCCNGSYCAATRSRRKGRAAAGTGGQHYMPSGVSVARPAEPVAKLRSSLALAAAATSAESCLAAPLAALRCVLSFARLAAVRAAAAPLRCASNDATVRGRPASARNSATMSATCNKHKQATRITGAA